MDPASNRAFNVEAFEIEQGTGSQSLASNEERCRSVFPLNLFCCCPSQLTAFIPNAWKTFQDSTHLILFIGTIANLMMLFETVGQLLRRLPIVSCNSPVCVNEAMCLLFSMPCTIYFVRILGHYDERLQAKQNAAKAQRAKLTSELARTINDMEGLLSRSAESSAGLAEQGFESKRRDFVRFLEHVQDKSAFLTTQSKELVSQFRRFVFNWLKVFEECSIDPVNHPRTVCSSQDLDACMSVAEICTLALSRLEHIEICFISRQREKDSKLMNRKRDIVRQVSSEMDAVALEPWQGGRARSLPLQSSKSSQPSWIYASNEVQFSCKKSEYDVHDGHYPIEFKFCCVTFVVLSREHFMLMSAFLASFVILSIQMIKILMEPEPNKVARRSTLLFEVTVDLVCLVVVLLRFEEIDVIQQLEREVRTLKATTDEVDAQHTQMNEFWGNAMELSELWLYRTVPRLDLYKEIHQHIEDCTEPKKCLNRSLAQYMANVNQKLEEMESNLGQLEAWQENDKYTTAEKKRFMQAMNRVCRIHDPDQLLDVLGASVDNKKAIDSWAESDTTQGSKSATKSMRKKVKKLTAKANNLLTVSLDNATSSAASPRGRSPVASPRGRSPNPSPNPMSKEGLLSFFGRRDAPSTVAPADESDSEEDLPMGAR